MTRAALLPPVVNEEPDGEARQMQRVAGPTGTYCEFRNEVRLRYLVACRPGFTAVAELLFSQGPAVLPV